MKIKNSFLLATFIAIFLLLPPCKSSNRVKDSHIKGWILSGMNAKDYQSGIDKNIKYSGAASAFLSSTLKKSSDKSATLMQIIKATNYKGKRIRMTAWVKTGNLDNGATFWMEISGKTRETTAGGTKFIKGNSDWKQYTFVVDADTSSVFIEFGILLRDTGRVWIDEVKIETVGKDVESTIEKNKKITSISNLSFEKISSDEKPVDWWGAFKETNYEISSDKSVYHDGAASACLKSVEPKIKSNYDFGVITGALFPDSLKGKRVRMNGWLKTESITDWAGLWMRVDGKNWGQTYSFDNMWKRRIKGTTDWKKYEIVLDVPQQATSIYFGALLNGNGKLWLDEIKFDVVGNDVPSTSTYTSKGKSSSLRKIKKHLSQNAQLANDSPINLDFEG
jgi:hypothetical protein